MQQAPTRSPSLTGTRTVAPLIAALLAAFHLAPALSSPARAREWSGDLVRSPQAWSVRYNDALVTASGAGLRVEVAPGKTWAIAAVPKARLPRHIREIRVGVRELGGGGRWLMRLWGDLRGSGSPSGFSGFEAMAAEGESRTPVDPRLLGLPHRPALQVQLGVEGEPGAYALFDRLEFIASPPPAKAPAVPGQLSIECVDRMPSFPRPYKMKDWRALAHAYDRFVFDFGARGRFLPLIWLDDSRINIDRPTFGLYSYVGDTRQGGANHEGINAMGAVLAATVAGIDKRLGEHDYVRMCEAHYNSRNGSNLVLNHMDQGTGGSFWYEVWPHVLFYALADRYPGAGRLDAILRTTAGRWCDALRVLAGPDGVPDLDHTAFDFGAMKPVDNGKWKEPDAAAGIAWLQYAAWMRTGEARYLNAAEACLRFLDRREANPYYEVLLPWGALTAARLNAERGRRYDVRKMVEWCFGISDCRGGWGVTLGRWGGYDCAGLVGSVDNRGGYAFAMNTFAQAGALVPLVRYDPRFARAVGRWMLNLANAARLFYPKELPESHQSSAFWKGDPEGVIAYEGLRREWNGKSPYATGDPLVMKWGPQTDLALYGSSCAGFLGGIVRTTNVQGILALDCLATDFFRAPAYPTHLVYNPHRRARDTRLPLGELQIGDCRLQIAGVSARRYDLYDAVSHQFVARGVSGTARVRVPGDRAVVLVIVPAKGKLTRDRGKLAVDGVVVDYAAGK